MKIIFLDIDGVLNNEEWLSGKEYKERKYVEINGEQYRNDIDERLLKNLKVIVNHTGAEIVLSSSWRNAPKDHSVLTYLNYMLNKYGLSIMDKTGKVGGGFRPREIKNWLDTHDDMNIEAFVILDDDFTYNDYSKCGIEKHLVETHFYGKDGGLQLYHSGKAIQILNNKYEIITKDTIRKKVSEFDATMDGYRAIFNVYILNKTPPEYHETLLEKISDILSDVLKNINIRDKFKLYTGTVYNFEMTKEIYTKLIPKLSDCGFITSFTDHLNSKDLYAYRFDGIKPCVFFNIVQVNLLED